MKPTDIFLTQEDRVVLLSVVRNHPENPYREFLEQEVNRAKVVHEEELPPGVVSLHSRAQVLAEHSCERGELTVVPPNLAHTPCGYVSVLSPVGAAIIGLSQGDAIDLESPSGIKRRYRVVRVSHQPEAQNKICVAS